MDATNRQVIAQLADIAAAFFASLDVEPGTYTAAELADNRRSGDKLKRPIYTLPELPKADPTEEQILGDLYNNEPLTVAAGSFVCEFPRHQVFNLLWKFEQMERVPQKEKKRFAREKEAEGITFYINIPKEAKNAAKFAGVDEYRPNLCQILLDLENSALVASDTHILGEFAIGIEGDRLPELPKGWPQICINPKHVKNLIGRVRVDVSEAIELADYNPEIVKTRTYTATFTNEAREVYINELNRGRFPDYRRVYPGQLSTDGYLQLTPKAVKSAQKLFKSLKKDDCCVFSFSVEEGATYAKVACKDECYNTRREFSLELTRPAAASLAIGLGPSNLINALPTWGGGIWLMDPSRPAIFDCKGTRAVLVMPRLCEELPDHTNTKGDISTLERANYLPEGIVTDKVKTARNRTKTAKIEVEADNVETSKIAENAETCNEAKIIAFVKWLADTLDSIVKSLYRAEISRTVDRLRELATLAGVDILDILAEAVPIDVEEVQTITNAAEVVEEPPIVADVCPVEIVRPVVSTFMVDVCRGDAPPGYMWPTHFANVPRRNHQGGQHRIRDGTINHISQNCYNFVIPKYFNSS